MVNSLQCVIKNYCQYCVHWNYLLSSHFFGTMKHNTSKSWIVTNFYHRFQFLHLFFSPKITAISSDSVLLLYPEELLESFTVLQKKTTWVVPWNLLDIRLISNFIGKHLRHSILNRMNNYLWVNKITDHSHKKYVRLHFWRKIDCYLHCLHWLV